MKIEKTKNLLNNKTNSLMKNQLTHKIANHHKDIKESQAVKMINNDNIKINSNIYYFF